MVHSYANILSSMIYISNTIDTLCHGLDSTENHKGENYNLYFCKINTINTRVHIL